MEVSGSKSTPSASDVTTLDATDEKESGRGSTPIEMSAGTPTDPASVSDVEETVEFDQSELLRELNEAKVECHCPENPLAPHFCKCGMYELSNLFQGHLSHLPAQMNELVPQELAEMDTWHNIHLNQALRGVETVHRQWVDKQAMHALGNVDVDAGTSLTMRAAARALDPKRLTAPSGMSVSPPSS